eukprot:6199195-Pleurochrysis_carterae.AAC.1
MSKGNFYTRENSSSRHMKLRKRFAQIRLHIYDGDKKQAWAGASPVNTVCTSHKLRAEASRTTGKQNDQTRVQSIAC